MNRTKNLIFIVSLLIWFPGHAESVQHEKPSLLVRQQEHETAADSVYFRKGYESFQKKRYAEAAEFLYSYLKNNTPDDIDYEWAEFFFGISLRKLGFTHASLDVLSHLVMRKPNPKIVSYSLELLEEITRTIPYDREQVIDEVISGHEYGFIDQDLSDFMHFYQGVFDWEHGFFQWGKDHFTKITPGTYYFYKYLYHKALHSIYEDKIDDAIDILKQILKSPIQSDDFRDEVRKTLARLHYEKGQFNKAEFMYDQIKKPMLAQSQNLLERAWVHYRSADNEKAMGLLYAFKAPSFQDFFTPEYYILKSFIYKSVCHYQKALSVVEEFNSHYGDSLGTIYNRGMANDNPTLLQVILNKKRILEKWQFLLLLEKEREKSREFTDKDLYDYIYEIYDLQIRETIKDFKKMVKEEYEKMANDLLQYEEEAHLIEYEIGLDMYQRVNQYHYTEDARSDENKQGKGRKVAYPFQGEFWTDELDAYEVSLPDKCNAAEEWDVFFK
jgi:hypothetical protein